MTGCDPLSGLGIFTLMPFFLLFGHPCGRPRLKGPATAVVAAPLEFTPAVITVRIGSIRGSRQTGALISKVLFVWPSQPVALPTQLIPWPGNVPPQEKESGPLPNGFPCRSSGKTSVSAVLISRPSTKIEKPVIVCSQRNW